MSNHEQSFVNTWRHDLINLIRNPLVILVGMVIPAVVMWIISLAASTPDLTTYELGVVDDGSEIATAIIERPLAYLDSQEAITVTEFPSRDALVAAIQADEIDAGLAIDPSLIEVVSRPDSVIASLMVNAAAEREAWSSNIVNSIISFETESGLEPDDPDHVRVFIMSSWSPPVVDSSSETGALNADSLLAKQMAFFFLFFSVQFGIINLVNNRRNNTRHQHTNNAIRPWTIVAARLAATTMIGIISMSVLVVWSTTMLSISWGNPVGVGLLIVAGTLAATTTVTLVTGLSRSADHAAYIHSLIALGLGLVGGTFFSISPSGPIGHLLTRLTPHHWFAEGLIQVGDSGWQGVLIPTAWLIGFSLLLGIPGGVCIHRRARSWPQ